MQSVRAAVVCAVIKKIEGGKNEITHFLFPKGFVSPPISRRIFFVKTPSRWLFSEEKGVITVLMCKIRITISITLMFLIVKR